MGAAEVEAIDPEDEVTASSSTISSPLSLLYTKSRAEDANEGEGKLVR
jgi:hypothetical protein